MQEKEIGKYLAQLREIYILDKFKTGNKKKCVVSLCSSEFFPQDYISLEEQHSWNEAP